MKICQFFNVVNLSIVPLLFILGGCASPTILDTTPSDEAIPAVSTIVITRESSDPPLLSTISTPMTTSTIPIITPTTTPASLSTPTMPMMSIPTPVGRDLDEKVLWLFETNNGCPLPCWWGITPGYTTWAIAEPFFDAFAITILSASFPESVVYTPVIPFSSEIYEVSDIHSLITVHDGIVDSILISVAGGGLDPDTLTQYTLSEFLNTYGQPSEIWLSTYGSSFEENDLPFFVVLFYPEHGIVASYSDNGVRLGDSVHGCPQQNPVATLYLWSPHGNLTFEDLVNSSSAFNREYLSLEEATEMDVATFYEIFKNPDNTTCLETPASLWR